MRAPPMTVALMVEVVVMVTVMPVRRDVQRRVFGAIIPETAVIRRRGGYRPYVRVLKCWVCQVCNRVWKKFPHIYVI